ncbi:conserved domain protein [Parvimonas sp. oral taxon 393 str. F0440]|nr:conserved domain protein [Parvimonas sp. oral taxon 393 str. F0440]
MKYKKLIFSSIGISLFCLTILLFFVLRGNFFRYTDINSMISEPKANSLLVSGTWQLTSITSLSDGSESKITDDKLYINKEIIYFEKTKTTNPKFKFRQVNFKNYLLYNGVVTDKINIDSEDVIVVSIRDERNFYKEFIIINKNKIATIHNKKYYMYEKISDDVDKNNIGELNSNDNSQNSKKDISFLIGVKSVGTKDVDYETFLFRKNGDEKPTFNKIEGLFINNKNKFFLVNSTNDGIYVSNDYINNSNRIELAIKNATINFLSKNYISLESYNSETNKKIIQYIKLMDYQMKSKYRLKILLEIEEKKRILII